MPIIVGPSAISENFLGLTNNILRECGEHVVDSLATPSTVTQLAMDYLNYTVEDIWNAKDWYFAEATHVWAPVADQEGYRLPDDFDRVGSDPRYKNYQLRWRSKDKMDRDVPDQSQLGGPTAYTIWEHEMLPYPITDTAFVADKAVLGTDGFVYACSRKHTATAATEPTTGADWQDWWVLDADATTAPAWVAGADYTIALTMPYYRRPVVMVNDGDWPDIPDKFIETLKIGARAKLKKYLEAADATEDYALYNLNMVGLKRRGRQSQGPYRMRLYR